MNPATPGPLTVLLVPPDGDTALLAEEVRAWPPQVGGYACNNEAHGLWWAFDTRNEPPICEVCSARKRWSADRALILVHEDVPAWIGIDRAGRVSGYGTPDSRATLDFVAEWARQVAAKLGARVVLLRGGREVGS